MPLRLVTRAGSNNWYVRGTLLGQTVCRSTRECELKHAKIRLKEIEAEVRGERRRTFGEAATAYLAEGGSDRFLAPLLRALGRIQLANIRQDNLDRILKAAYPRVETSTLNRHGYTPFIAIWNFAVRKEWAAARTWARPRPPRGSTTRRRLARTGTHPVSYDRAAEFVAAMSPAPAMVMTTLFYTGMRPIEALSLTTCDIDVAGRWIIIRNSKTGEPRGVPMHEFLVPLLAALKSRGGSVFRSPKGLSYTPRDEGGGQLKTSINGARRRSGITNISPYTGQHSASTQLVVNGIHPYIKDQILGHAGDSMSRHYTHIPQKPLLDAINTLPVPPLWRDQPWWDGPLSWAGRLVEGTGARNDLKRGVR